MGHVVECKRELRQSSAARQSPPETLSGCMIRIGNSTCLLKNFRNSKLCGLCFDRPINLRPRIAPRKRLNSL